MSQTHLRTLPLIAAALLLGLLSTTSFAQANPSEATNQRYRNNPCRDPWISYGFLDVTASTDRPRGWGDLGDCNPANYNGGSWRSYAELAKAIRDYRNAMYYNRVKYITFYNPNTRVWGVALIDLNQRGAVLGGQLISQEGANLGTNPAQIVAQGGLNIVAQGGLNIVAQSAGHLLSPNGSNLYSLQAGAKRVIRLGPNSAIIIK